MKIETRADCLVCGAEIVDARFRTYCSDKCRVKRNNEKGREYAKQWALKNKDRINRNRKMRILQARIKKQNNAIQKL